MVVARTREREDGWCAFAKLAHKGRAALEQLSLGHASIVTTEKHLGTRLDLQDAPCDHLGLRLLGLRLPGR